MDNLDPDLKDVFDKLGLSEKELREDKDTAQFIYDFIEKHGGIEAVKEQTRLQAQPMVNTRPVAPPQPPTSVGQTQYLSTPAGMYCSTHKYSNVVKLCLFCLLFIGAVV